MCTALLKIIFRLFTTYLSLYLKAHKSRKLVYAKYIYYTHINGVHKQVGITERKSKLQISSGLKIKIYIYYYIHSEEFENSI